MSELPPPTSEQMQFLKTQYEVSQRVKGGASWFYWIAGVTVLNSLVALSGSDWNFLVGLGVTQVIDGIAQAISTEVESTAGMIVRGVGLSLDIGIAAIFGLFGWFARKQYAWSFIVGMVLYGLDALLFVLFESWLNVGLHAFALFGLYGGLKAISTLRIMTSPMPNSTVLQ